MVNSTIQKSLLAVAILTASLDVTSKEISYDYLQGTYASTSIDVDNASGDIDGNSFGIAGSFIIVPNIAVTTDYLGTSFDTFQGIDADTTAISLGVTAYASIASNTSIFGNFSALRGDVKTSGGTTDINDDDTGKRISIGLRHLVSDAIEVNVGLSYLDIFDEIEKSHSLGVRFYANEVFSFGIGLAASSDVDILTMDVRFDLVD